jgi:hypothetical protein
MALGAGACMGALPFVHHLARREGLLPRARGSLARSPKRPTVPVKGPQAAGGGGDEDGEGHGTLWVDGGRGVQEGYGIAAGNLEDLGGPQGAPLGERGPCLPGPLPLRSRHRPSTP